MNGDAVRPLNAPSPAAVDASNRGVPVAVLWHGVYRRVRAIHDTWRIDDEWWRDEVSRRYFEVELDSGRRLTLYRDLVQDLWYVQPYQPGRDGKRTAAAG
ncbi:MAG: hypothetical protein KC432_17545 [Thermomicrobiales bacterium]|nr:hypothetical protein [Thermomicrobiales bacterium]